MPAELLLVNPRRKRRAKRAKTSARRKRRVNPRRATAKRRRRVVGYAVGSAPVRRRKLNPRKRRAHRARRRANPRLGGFSIKGITSALIPAAVGGAGAVALDVGLSYLPASTPEFLRSGIGNKALKIGGALALGMIAGKILGRETGRAVGAGALTVVAYGIVRDVVRQVAPTLPGMSGMDGLSGDYSLNPAPMLQRMGAYMTAGADSFQAAQMGAYMANDGM